MIFRLNKPPLKIILYIVLSFIVFPVNNAAFSQQKTYAGINYLHRLQDKRTAGKTSLFKFVSGTATPVSIGAPLTFFVTGLITKNNILKKEALFLLESFAISQTISFATKAIVNKPRPFEVDSTLIGLRNANNASFPSGHTSEAFAAATSFALINHKWYVVVPAYTWAGLVAYSRLYLGVHFPIDVLAGIIVGTGSAWISYKLNKWMHKPKEKVKEAPAY